MKFDVGNRYFVIAFGIVILLVLGGLLSFLFIDTSDDESENGKNFDWIFPKSNLKINYNKINGNDESDMKIYYDIMRDDKILQRVYIKSKFNNDDIDYTTNDKSLTLKALEHSIIFNIEIDTEDFILFHVNRTLKKNEKVMDCFEFSNGTSWYGGPEQMKQYWPVEKIKLENHDYLSKEFESAGVSERYWLTSEGMFVYVSDRTPLFVHQNSDISKNQICFEARKELPYYTHDDLDFTMQYSIGIAKNAKLAQTEAINRILFKPTDIPDTDMVKYPVWSTWVRYKRDIDINILRTYANEIRDNGFKASQIDIDDLWEECYGSMKLDAKFATTLKNLTTDLRDNYGFNTTMWIHPFVNENCQPYYNTTKDAGFLVKNHNNSYATQWWNSDNSPTASHVDFTNPAARAWFRKNLDELREASGVTSFKFDAGESSFAPADPILTGSKDFWPHQLTVDFLETVQIYGSKLEIRVAQGTQHLPYFVRILDLDSRWSWDNGLPTLVPTVLLFNIVGYPFVLPDMIGGNNYRDDLITSELFIRWLQANVFMPALQFSYTPWDFDDETVKISKHFVEMHESYAEQIIERMRLAVKTGEPLNPPIWWIDPTDKVAQKIHDEFLLGEEILVAPVVTEGQIKRDIYLPIGKWKDGNSDKMHDGPIWIMDYDAPLTILPYFIKQ